MFYFVSAYDISNRFVSGLGDGGLPGWVCAEKIFLGEVREWCKRVVREGE